MRSVRKLRKSPADYYGIKFHGIFFNERKAVITKINNLLYTGGFEAGDTGFGISFAGFDSASQYEIDTSTKMEGGRSLRIDCPAV
jgi:hypothetical protein